MSHIEPFHVMDILARARALETKGKPIVHMEVGEPDFVTLPEIIEAGRKALGDGKVHYTPATGLPELRAAISDHYLREYSKKVDAGRIVVTPGASGALQLALGVTINPGDGVIMADPGYPCNRHMVAMYGGEIQAIPVDRQTNYQLTVALLEQYWQVNTRAVMLASPSNPTGTMIDRAELQLICNFAREKGALVVIDEIYNGLVYTGENNTAVDLGDNVIVINSFSKYFGMTGWRLGWMVVPEGVIPAIDHLAQNIFLAASTPAQHAAITALSPEVKAALDERRDIFMQRRDFLLEALSSQGFDIASEPQGAFYLYAGISRFSGDSMEFSRQLLEHTGVAITPGIDFGKHKYNEHVRFAYTTDVEELKSGVDRIKSFLVRQGKHS